MAFVVDQVRVLKFPAVIVVGDAAIVAVGCDGAGVGVGVGAGVGVGVGDGVAAEEPPAQPAKPRPKIPTTMTARNTTTG